jgi:hypothetical protein
MEATRKYKGLDLLKVFCWVAYLSWASMTQKYSLVRSEEGYKYAYGPSGIQGLLSNKRTFLYGAFASLGGLTFGYDLATIRERPLMYQQL